MPEAPRVRSESRAPQPVGEDGDALAADPILTNRQASPERRRHAQHWQEVRRYEDADNAFWLLQSGQVHALADPGSQSAKRVRHRAPVVQVRLGNELLLSLSISRVNFNQLVRRFKCQWF